MKFTMNITKVVNSEENSKRKVPHQMAKTKAETHQMNKQQLPYCCLGTGIFLCRKKENYNWFYS